MNDKAALFFITKHTQKESGRLVLSSKMRYII